ncbi:hypothetical protein LWI28_019135 [Acer negundo]|uniref:CCHC-type domain-containing protein n=1 Tax=Acer negundo TaxID=4023 RepID=A0AAD5NTJ1_ACENE|nr:hypothetical protein LWI28_019135 [Acer negundo]
MTERGSTSFESSGGVKFEAKPFDRKSNFTLWQRKMKNILSQQNLYFTVDEVEKKPKDMSTETWKVLDEKAMSSIELHLSNEMICNVMKEKSAKGTWEKLEKLYMGKTLSNKLTFKDQLYGLKMEKGGDVMAHLNDFNRCISNLIWVDVKYKEDDKALFILRSLPDSFKQVRGKLKGKDYSLRSIVRSKSEKNSRLKSRKKNVECYSCGKKGHYKWDCRKLKAEIKEGKKAETNSIANVVFKDNGELLLVASTSYAFDV